jgi:threonine synthase
MASAIQIGAPVSYERAVKIMQRFDGVVEQASEEELANMCALADRSGLYCCPQTGTALYAAKSLAEQGVIKPDERVVVISTANGLKFSQMKTDYHSRRLKDIQVKYGNAPIEIEASVEEVLRNI